MSQGRVDLTGVYIWLFILTMNSCESNLTQSSVDKVRDVVKEECRR